MPESHSQPTAVDTAPGPAADLRRIQARLPAGDAGAAQDLERLIRLSNFEASAREVAQLSLLREHRFISSWPVLGWPITALHSAVDGVGCLLADAGEIGCIHS